MALPQNLVKFFIFKLQKGSFHDRYDEAYCENHVIVGGDDSRLGRIIASINCSTKLYLVGELNASCTIMLMYSLDPWCLFAYFCPVILCGYGLPVYIGFCYLSQLPLYSVVSLGCYGLLMVGVGLMQFPTCPQESLLLQKVSCHTFYQHIKNMILDRWTSET